MTYTMRRDHRGVRRRVRVEDGIEGYLATATLDCSGCTERVEMGGTKYGPFGCDECGHTGRRRTTHFVPFDTAGDTKGKE